MKTLEGEAAINYLQRLTTTLDTEKSNTHWYSQNNLLRTLFSIQQAHCESLDPKQQAEIEITVNETGFPQLPSALVHVREAIKLHRQQSEQKKRLADHWLEVVAGLNPDTITAANQNLIKMQNPYPKITEQLNQIGPKKTDYLFSNSYNPGSHHLPISTTDSLPGMLVTHPTKNPFLDNLDLSDQVRMRNWLYGRKFIDAPNFPQNLPLGTKENPIDNILREDVLQNIPRPPIIIYYEFDDNPRYFPVQFPLSVWLTSSDPGKPNHETVHSPAKDKIERLNKPFILALCKIDLSNLSDQAIDDVLDKISQIFTLTSAIADHATKFAGNEDTNLEEAGKKSQELAGIINSIEDSATKAAIVLALNRIFTQSRQNLTK